MQTAPRAQALGIGEVNTPAQHIWQRVGLPDESSNAMHASSTERHHSRAWNSYLGGSFLLPST